MPNRSDASSFAAAASCISGENVAVSVHRDSDGGVTEPLTDYLRVDALAKELGRVAVAKSMEPAWKALVGFAVSGQRAVLTTACAVPVHTFHIGSGSCVTLRDADGKPDSGNVACALRATIGQHETPRLARLGSTQSRAIYAHLISE
jgi:hypothetical protein